MIGRPHVALATAAALPQLDAEDGPPLLAALGRHGVEAEPAVWDDTTVDWAAYDLVVIRSAWDYAPRREAFVAWADAVSARTRLANRAEVVRWNTDKRYLRDLAAAGLPVVPTTWLEPADPVRLPTRGEYVVKPAISAGAKDTARYVAGDAAGAGHAATLLAAGRTVMVQPYLAAVDSSGETGLMFVAGTYSHAVRKGPLLRLGGSFPAGLYAEEDIEPRSPSAPERDLAEAVLDAVPGGRRRLLYARVDLVTGPGGGPVLLELELTEPSLFLDCDPPAADRFAAAIAAAAASSGSGGG